MAELNSLTTSPVKAALAGAGKKPETIKAKRPQVKKLSDNSGRYIKLGLYGDFGTGKTYSLADLVEKHGLRILVISTDVGCDGLSTLVAELQRRGRADLADTHVFHVTLETYEQFVEFIENPTLYFPEIFDVDLDMLVWDGFSSFQQYQLSDYVEGLDTVISKDGSQITNKYWGEIRTATIKNLNRFLYLHNKKTGKLWHKLVTMLVNDAAKEESLLAATSETERQKLRKEVKVPFIQGSAAKLIGPAFDFFARTGTRRGEPNAEGKRPTEFVYNVEPNEKQKAKVRGVQFDPVIKADMGMVWGKLKEAYMIQPGQVSAEVKEEAS
jgi:hypothetical protein